MIITDISGKLGQKFHPRASARPVSYGANLKKIQDNIQYKIHRISLHNTKEEKKKKQILKY